MRLTVEGPPARALADEPFGVVVRGVAPGAEVTIRVQTSTYRARSWHGTFAAKAGADGVADLQEVALEGLDEPDPAALLWALGPARDVSGPSRPGTTPAEDLACTLTVRSGAETVEHTFVRVFEADGVTRADLDGPVVGSLCLPPGEGPYPAVVTVSGSGGGIDRYEAALLASRGFACLALAYFNFPGLPDELIGVPLEYFGEALEWLADHPGIRDDAIAVMGRSRGGELSLQLASTFPGIRAAVAVVPSGYRWGAMTKDERPGPSWTLHGEPLPWVHGHDSDWEQIVTVDGATELTPGFRSAIATASPEELEAARIPIELASSPVLLLCGGDDAMWDSVGLSDVVVQRAGLAPGAREVRRVVYAGAGHNLGLPYLPVLTADVHPVDGSRYAYGGTRAGTAAARVQAWQEVLGFLGKELGTAP